MTRQGSKFLGSKFLTYLVLYWPGWSSFSEVAAYWGGEGGRPVPILVAGRDFGLVVDAPPVLAAAPKRPAAMWHTSRLELGSAFCQPALSPEASVSARACRRLPKPRPASAD